MSRGAAPRPAALERLLEPDRLDRLEEVGAGLTGRVLRHRDFAVKVAHPFDRFRRQVDREAATLAFLQGGAVPVPRLHLRLRQRGFVRDYVAGPTLLELLRAGPLAPEVLAAARATLEAVEAYRLEHGTTLDFTPPNLAWSGGRLVLLDLGPRGDPSPFVGLAPADLEPALRAYAAPGAPRLTPAHWPPSGRFAVGVPVGPDPAARVVWRNQACLERVGLADLTDADLVAHFGLTTEAERPTTWRWASRYQDSAGIGAGEAQGDGRVVQAGATGAASATGDWEIALKGAGPTPLAWHGVKYHFDGRVSLPRTRWEASVCEGLAHLGLEAPRYLCILTTHAHTVDNSEVRRPAGLGVRASRTHARLGHLTRWVDEPEAFRVILDRALAGFAPGLSMGRRRDRARYVHRFACQLGFDAGRTESLNVIAFNPTPGNVRLDGHPIDFSTVRFLDRPQPDWRFMETAWTAKHHRWVFGKQVRRLADTLAQGLGLAEAERVALVTGGNRRFAAGFNAGYLSGLYDLAGGRPARPAGAAAQDLLHAARALRAERDPSGRTFTYRFWRQTVRAPAFSLEAGLGRLIADWRGGRPDPRALAEPGVEPTEAQRGRAGAFCAALEALFRGPGGLEPPDWHRIRPPVLEAEALADLLYARDDAEALDRWQTSLPSC